MEELSLLQLRDGRMIADERISERMVSIKNLAPERAGTDSTGFKWDDEGLADLFAEVYSNEVRYCPEYKSWYVYEGGCWRQDVNGHLAHQRLKEFSRLLLLYCGEILDDDLREKYTKFVSGLGDRRVRERIIRDAADEMSIPATQFDANPYLVNCVNGTYDLRTFEFYPSRWEDFLTMQTRFSHTVSRDVKCERWEQFISEVCCGDTEKMRYLQKALGYSLLGMASEECMFILYGKTTRNGKSTMLNTIQYMLGDYASVAPVGIICGRGGNSGSGSGGAEAASPVLASLKGKRFVTMAESNEYGRMDEEKLKQFTGGEEITARALYQKPVRFKPQFTLWLSCNDLPAVRDKSVFASDRLRVIEFTRHFNREEQDIHLKDELNEQKAMSGIFMWLVRGYKMYRDEGLQMGAGLRKVVTKYEKDNDIVHLFLEARCEKCDGESMRGSHLYKAYSSWIRTVGEHPMSARKFHSNMERFEGLFYEKTGLTMGSQMYRGIKFKEEVG